MFLVGILCFGPYASNLFHEILHFPMVIPEIIYMPLLYIFYRKGLIKMVQKPIFSKVIYLWLLLLIFAFAWGTYDVIAILSTARSFLLLGLFYVIGKYIYVDHKLMRILLILTLGSIFGWVISSYLNFQVFYGSEEQSVVYGNMLAIAYAFAILLLYNRSYILLALLLFANIYLSFTTSLRRQILVSLMSISTSLMLLTVKYKKISYLILIAILLIPIYLVMPQIEDYIKDANPYLHHRIFERSEEVLSHDMQSSDKGRIEHQLYVFTKFPELIIPHGYVSQNTTRDHTGRFNDVPNYMLAYTFGVLFFYYYFVIYIIKLFKTFRRFQLYDNEYYGVLFVISCILLFLHFVEASMFIYTYTVPFTGLTLGLLFRNDYIKLNKNEN